MRLTPAPLLVALTLAALPAQVAGQYSPTRCDLLRRDMSQLADAIRKDEANLQGYHAIALETDEGLREANDRAVVYSRQDLFGDLMTTEAELERMRRFKAAHQLSRELDAHISSTQPSLFWPGAVEELKTRLPTLAGIEALFTATIDRHRREMDAKQTAYQRDCSPVSQPGIPAPIERVRNIPVLTDAVISRWLRAWRAKDQNGGAYWQAGQMTQLDYQDIKDKVYRWIIYCGETNRRPEVDITEAECVVLGARKQDIMNAEAGKWSEVRM